MVVESCSADGLTLASSSSDSDVSTRDRAGGRSSVTPCIVRVTRESSGWFGDRAESGREHRGGRRASSSSESAADRRQRLRPQRDPKPSTRADRIAHRDRPRKRRARHSAVGCLRRRSSGGGPALDVAPAHSDRPRSSLEHNGARVQRAERTHEDCQSMLINQAHYLRILDTERTKVKERSPDTQYIQTINKVCGPRSSTPLILSGHPQPAGRERLHAHQRPAESGLHRAQTARYGPQVLRALRLRHRGR